MSSDRVIIVIGNRKTPRRGPLDWLRSRRIGGGGSHSMLRIGGANTEASLLSGTRSGPARPPEPSAFSLPPGPILWRVDAVEHGEQHPIPQGALRLRPRLTFRGDSLQPFEHDGLDLLLPRLIRRRCLLRVQAVRLVVLVREPSVSLLLRRLTTFTRGNRWHLKQGAHLHVRVL